MSMSVGDRSRMIGQQQTMQDLARVLRQMLNSIVTDATGLSAKYDFTVTFAGIEPVETLASTSAAEPAPAEVMVIDHMEKTPTGN